MNRLLAALNTAGPVNWCIRGSAFQKVQVGRVTHRLSTKEGGIAYISFEVYEAGEQLFPSGTEDTSATTLSAADKVKEALGQR
ncbi:Mu-like prophage DNA circulation protein [Klebsiella pneumoniae]|uniref:Mu-like prophage DNA circulation protein n=1 Tax=Klebsiella pneumoniae TaxID=573 RepID=A0AB74GTC5_KLEPN|nr:Mu-like prophage DNA circulation protein [Klebsiella pneumoniae]